MKRQNRNSDESISIDPPEKRPEGLPLVQPELISKRAPLSINATPICVVPDTPRLPPVSLLGLP